MNRIFSNLIAVVMFVAAATIPTPALAADATHIAAAQANLVSLKKGAFIHFNLPTFDGGAAYGSNIQLFQPTGEVSRKMVSQWLDIIQAAGCNYATLTTYHGGDFSLWYSTVNPRNPSAVTLATTGQACPDIVDLFVQECTARHFPYGFYLYSDPTSTTHRDQVNLMLAELATKYNPVYFWLDNNGGTATVDPTWMTLYKTTVEAIKPAILVGQNKENPTVNTAASMAGDTDFYIEETLGVGGSTALTSIVFASTCSEIANTKDLLNHWFDQSDVGQPMKGPQEIRSILMASSCISRTGSFGVNYLLNIAPSKTGYMLDTQIKLFADASKPVIDLVQTVALSQITATSHFNTAGSVTAAAAAAFGPQNLVGSPFNGAANNKRWISSDADLAPVVEIDLLTAQSMEGCTIWNTVGPGRFTDYQIKLYNTSHTLIWQSDVFNVANGNVSDPVNPQNSQNASYAAFDFPTGIRARFVSITRTAASGDQHADLVGWSIAQSGIQWQFATATTGFVDVVGQTGAFLTYVPTGANVVRQKITTQATNGTLTTTFGPTMAIGVGSTIVIP